MRRELFFFLTTNCIYLQESIGIKTKKIGKQKKKAIYNKVEKDVFKKEVYLIKCCFDKFQPLRKRYLKVKKS